MNNNYGDPYEMKYGGKLYLNDEDEFQNIMISEREYEPIETSIIKALPFNYNCIDIGAHIGYFTILMGLRTGNVLSFEPECKNYIQLCDNVQLNGLMGKVLPLDYAVGSHECVADLFISNINSGQHRIFPSRYCKAGIQRVAMVKLDDQIFRKYIDTAPIPPHFIKMDAEGTEFDILIGAEQTIKAFKPIILLEFHPDTIREYGKDPKDEFEYIKSLGYTVYLTDDMRLTTPTMFTKYITKYEELEWLTNVPVGGKNLYCRYG